MPGVCGALQKACVRNSHVLLEAPLLGSTLKSLEEVCLPPRTSRLLVFKIALVHGQLPKILTLGAGRGFWLSLK